MGKTAQRARRKAIAQYLYQVHSSETEWMYKQMTGRLRWEKDYEKERAAYEYHVQNVNATYEHALASAKARYETDQKRVAADLAIKRAQAMQLDTEQAKQMAEAEQEKFDAMLKARKQEADVTVTTAAFAMGRSQQRMLKTIQHEAAEAQGLISLKEEMQADILDAQRIVMQRQAEATQVITPYIPPKAPVTQAWVEPLEYIDPLYIRPHDPTAEAFEGGAANWGPSGLTVGMQEQEVTAEWLQSLTDLTPEEIEEFYGIPVEPVVEDETEEDTEIEYTSVQLESGSEK